MINIKIFQEPKKSLADRLKDKESNGKVIEREVLAMLAGKYEFSRISNTIQSDEFKFDLRRMGESNY